jgi:hypothetical protein
LLSTDAVNVVASLGFVGHLLDHLVSDRRTICLRSVALHIDHQPFGKSFLYCSVIGMAWMTAGPCGRSITTSSRRFPDGQSSGQAFG